jgi:hypothetical protein
VYLRNDTDGVSNCESLTTGWSVDDELTVRQADFGNVHSINKYRALRRFHNTEHYEHGRRFA